MPPTPPQICDFLGTPSHLAGKEEQEGSSAEHSPESQCWQRATLISSPNSRVLTDLLTPLAITGMQIPRWKSKNQCQKPWYGVGVCKSARKMRAEWWVGPEKGTDLEARTAVYLHGGISGTHTYTLINV